MKNRKRSNRVKQRARARVREPLVEFQADADPALPVTPHAFRVECRAPRIGVFFTPQAFADMSLLIDLCPVEIGWLGEVTRLPSGDFLVDNIIMPKQTVNRANTTLTPEGLAEIGADLLAQPDGLARANSLRFWGHSHADMAVGPSGQDDAQMEDFASAGVDYFIRAIGNKAGALVVDVFVYQPVRLTVLDTVWSILPAPREDRRKYWAAELNRKASPSRMSAFERRALQEPLDPQYAFSAPGDGLPELPSNYVPVRAFPGLREAGLGAGLRRDSGDGGMSIGGDGMPLDRSDV